MVMSFRRKGWVGVDLGTRTVKLAQVERVGAQLRLAGAVVWKRARPPASKEAVKSRDDWSVDEIRGAVAMRPEFQGRRAACVLPMHVTDLQALSIPAGTDDERKAMVDQELCSVLQGNMQDYVADFWEIDAPGESRPANAPNINVLVAPEQLASRIGKVLSDSKLYCENLDGLPLAMARSVQLVEPAGDASPVAVLDWGFRGATFCAVSNGRPLFTRYLRDCGVSSLAEMTGKALGLTLEESEQLLTSHGIPHPTIREQSLVEVQEVIAEAGSQRIMEFVGELEQTLSYVKSERPELFPQRIWLSGGGATVKNIAPALAANLGLPVEVWRPRDSCDSGNGSENYAVEMLGNAMALSALPWVQ